MYDLNITPPKPISMDDDGESSEAPKHYPCARIPLEAVLGAPTDGSEFTVTVKCCARSVDNKDKSMDMELKSIQLVGGKAKAEAPKKNSFRETVVKKMADESGEAEDY